MKVKVLKTTDKKYEGSVFDIASLTPESISIVTGKNFDFNNINYIENDIVELQSSHYTIKIKIISQ